MLAKKACDRKKISKKLCYGFTPLHNETASLDIALG